MAYSVPWDETRPPGATTPAADLDVVIQDVQIALRERLEQVIEDFANDGTDPKIMIEGTARVLVDIATNLPANPDFEGQVFFAEDTVQLYVGDSGLNWILQNPSTAGHPVGPLIDRPAGAKGDWWYRAEEDGLANAGEGVAYVRDDIGWRVFAPLQYAAKYDDALGAGSKVTSTQYVPVVIWGFFDGTTDAGGTVTLNFREIQDDLFSSLGTKFVLNKNALVTVIATMADPGTSDDYVIRWRDYDNLVTPDSVDFEIWDLNAQIGGGDRPGPVVSQDVHFSFMLVFDGFA
ncbi:MAG: hypothetical protein ACYSW3_26495 [Planctomycetota bacterium]|jgi:hypothetical protein